MFERAKLQKKIQQLSGKIADLENQRYRLQGALVEAALTDAGADEMDVHGFNRCTDEIDRLRGEIQALRLQLDGMKG